MKRDNKRRNHPSTTKQRGRELHLDEMESVTGGDCYLQMDRGGNNRPSGG